MECSVTKMQKMENAKGGSLAADEGAPEKAEPTPLRNEAPLNCVSLRSQLELEVTWRTVKGLDERPCGTPLTAPHVTPGVLCIAGKTIRRAATSALDFFDLLIEG